MSETSPTVEAKAERLIDAGAVTVISRSEEVVVAAVQGDSNTYRVTLSADGAFEGCSCPAMTRCSHIEAVAYYMTQEGLMEPPEATDSDVLELGVDQEPDQYVAGPDRRHIFDVEVPALGPDAERSASAAVDSETGEIVPRAEIETALLPIAEAPVTYQTLRAISSTDFVPAALRGRPDAILAAVLYGAELGLPPMQSLAHVDVVDGRPSPSAELTARMVRAAGHGIEVVESSDTACRLRGTRADTKETLEVTFTIEDAARVTTRENQKVIPLSETKRYREYPGDMLWARAITRLARRLFPDVQGLDRRDARPTGS